MCYDGVMDGANPSSSLSIPASMPTRRKVLSLRYMGYESHEIADALGISEGTVQHHINAAVTASADKERVNIVREAEMTKLEQLEEAFTPLALGEASTEDGPIPPQASAAKVVLDVMDRRAKLMGIDKAQPPQTTNNLTLIQILSQLPSAQILPQSLVERQLEGSSQFPSSLSREATDA